MAKTKEKKKFDASVANGKIVRVTNRGAEGYRRAGISHAAGAINHEPGKFDDDQIEQLATDPRLQVDFVDPPKAEKAANEKKD